MNRRMVTILAVLAALAVAAYVGYRDGRGHRNPPVTDSGTTG